MSKNITLKIVFILILLFAFLLRIYHVSQVPPGLFCDEAATGYNAYSVLHTGRDEYGILFPAFFRSFNNFRAGFPIYFTIPFIMLFGLSEFSVRIAPAVIGTLTVGAIFFLTQELCSSKRAGFIAMAFLAISPWHIQFSRYGEGNVYLPFFLTLALLFFLLAIRLKKEFLFSLCFISFGLGFYTYFPSYFLIPIFMISLCVIFYRELLHHKTKLVIPSLLLLIVLIPFLSGILKGEILERFHQVSMANSNKTAFEIVSKIFVTYTDHFKPEFLFTKGDIGYPTHLITRFSIRGMGELYLFQFPFIFFGLFSLFKKGGNFLLIACWLILYPLGSTLAPFTDGGGPFASRSIIGVIPFQILTGAGIAFCLQCIKKKSIKFIFSVCAIIFFGISFKGYFIKYFYEYPLYSANFWGWQYGPQSIMKYFVKNQKEYDELIIVGDFNAPYIFVHFYDPENTCQSKCRFGTLFQYNPYKKQLFAIAANRLNKLPGSIHFKAQETIRYPNSDPAFYIGTFRNY